MQRVECPFDIPEGQEVTCGILKVPDESGSGLIEEVDLQVTIYASKNPTPEPDPVVFLGYEPEASRFLMSRGFFSSFSENRQILFFTRQNLSETEGESNADCPELADLSLNFLQQLRPMKEYSSTILDAHQECRERLAGSNAALSGSSAAQTAGDVMAIRQSLGYKQINLYANGSSTLAVLKLLEQNPDAVRSATLTSFYPPLAAADLESSYSSALQRLFESCGADEACNSAYPDLDLKFQADVERLDREPLMIEVKHPTKPDMLKVYVDGERFIYFIRDMLGSGNSFPRIPAMIEEIYKGQGYKLAADIQGSLMFRAFQQQGGLPSSQCIERFAANPVVTMGAAPLAPEIQEALETDYDLQLEVCSMWVQENFTPPEVKAAATGVPVLVLQGAYDATYGPELVEGWMKGFKQGQLIVLQSQGGRFGLGSCVSGIVTEFLQNPGQDVDTACIDTQPVEFILPIH